MLSKKVEIFGQNPGFRGGSCGGTDWSNRVKIDRQFPDELQGHMTVYDYTKFCEDVDKKLGSVNRALMRCWNIIGCVAKIFLGIGVIVSISNIVRGMDPTGLIIGAVFIPLVYLLWRYSAIRSAWNNAADKIRRVCKTESDKRPAVNFHLREERHYTSCTDRGVTYFIELIVDDEGSSGVMEQGLANAAVTMAVATPVYDGAPIDVTAASSNISSSGAKATSPSANSNAVKAERSKDDRLQDLNQMVAMLTEEEYNRTLQRIENDTGNLAIPIPVDQMEELERQRATLSEGVYATQKKNILENM